MGPVEPGNIYGVAGNRHGSWSIVGQRVCSANLETRSLRRGRIHERQTLSAKTVRSGPWYLPI